MSYSDLGLPAECCGWDRFRNRARQKLDIKKDMVHTAKLKKRTQARARILREFTFTTDYQDLQSRCLADLRRDRGDNQLVARAIKQRRGYIAIIHGPIWGQREVARKANEFLANSQARDDQ